MDALTPVVATTDKTFHLTVLGRTLEHMGVQLYKKRPAAIAELVANAWDAGATSVKIVIPKPESYDSKQSIIVIKDNGSGMDENDVEDKYLVIGRNRREDDARDQDANDKNNRPVMGRKGIGKLAGFGLASDITLDSWRDGKMTSIDMSLAHLKVKSNEASKVPIPGRVKAVGADEEFESGTRIILKDLKHTTSIDIASIHESLARRFSRTIRGQMLIEINEEVIKDVQLKTIFDKAFEEYTLSTGDIVRFKYACTEKPIASPELRGFTIYANGKTVQAPPFYFNIESTAHGQHGTKYLSGEIEADFLDSGTDDESDIVSTDRQEVDWENERVKELLVWGQVMSRKAITECAESVGNDMKDWLLEQPQINDRVVKLSLRERTQISSFLRTIGKSVGNSDDDKIRALDLSDSLLKVYEFRQFHDIISTVEEIGDDPDRLSELLVNLQQWKVLESRAILEIVKGRLEIIDKFEKMVTNDAPETTKMKGNDNMHDLIAGYPWLLNPEWQVYAEEKYLSTQLKEWLYDDVVEEDARLRYDFLALSNNSEFIVIEIKRSGHPVELHEIQRLEKYYERLASAKNVTQMMLIYGKTLNVSDKLVESWESSDYKQLVKWQNLVDRAKKYYEHYRVLLQGDISDVGFARKQTEVVQTRQVLNRGSVYRGPVDRETGLGIQDTNDFMD